MAKEVCDESGFKVLEISRREIVSVLGGVGAYGICDNCGKSPDNGYYVAVLNHWLCPACYQEFINRNRPCPEDAWFENRMFNQYKQIFSL